jgi:hypothetical protein
MKRILRYGLIALAVGAPSLSLCSRDIPLVAGTLVQCTLDEPNFSSRTAKIGEPLICYARPLSEFGCTALPKGTELAGRFIDYKDPGRLLGKGWMELEFDRLILPDGEAPASMRVISVHGYKVDTDGRILGRGHVWRDAVGWALPVLWPVKLATLPMRGPRPTLKGERAITLRLIEDVRIPCRGFGTDVFRSSFHYFESPGENHAETASASTGEENVPTGPSMSSEPSPRKLPTHQGDDSSGGRRPLAFQVGHHTLFITTSGRERGLTLPRERSQPE